MRRRWTLASAVVCALALVSCSKSEREPDGDPDGDRAKRMASTVMAGLRVDDSFRTEAIVKALASSAPRADLGPCPIPIVAGRTTRVALADVATTPGLRFTKGGDRIASELAHPPRGLVGYRSSETIEKLGRREDFPWEIVVVIEEQQEPRIVDEKRFEGGVLRGRALLYDYVAGAVRCASVFVAGSTQRVRSYDSNPKAARDALLKELENEALQTAEKALVAVGPKLTDAGTDAR